MALDRYLEIANRRKWVLLAPLVLALLGAAGVTLLMPRVYESSATVRIALAGQGDGQPLQPQHVERVSATYVQIVQSRPVLSSVIQSQGLDTTPEKLLDRIDVEAIEGTELIRITAEGGSPEEARDLADALAGALVAEGQSFYLNSSNPSLANSFSVLEGALLPDGPVQPSLPLNIAIGLGIGLAAGVGLALALEYTDKTLRGAKDLSAITSLPVLGSIPRARHRYLDGARSSMSVVHGSGFPISGEYRALAANLRILLEKHELKSILVTSAWADEGATLVALSISVATAQSGLETLLMDANLHDPSLHEIFQVTHWPGLRNILVRPADGSRELRAAIADAARRSPVAGLDVLTGGSELGDPAQLLASTEMRELVRLLGSHVPLTIIDGPSILDCGDAAALAPMVDGVIVVFAEGIATTDSVGQTLEQLETVGANVLGLVYNEAARR